MLARVLLHVLAECCTTLARVVVHALARVLPHMLARVLLHVLARVIIHVHDYYLKTCLRGPTSSWRPFGPAWLRYSRPSGAQAVWPTRCNDWIVQKITEKSNNNRQEIQKSKLLRKSTKIQKILDFPKMFLKSDFFFFENTIFLLVFFPDLFLIFVPVVLTPVNLWYLSWFPWYCHERILWSAEDEELGILVVG